MSYPNPPVFTEAAPPGSTAADSSIRSLLADLAGRKEFRVGEVAPATPQPPVQGFMPSAELPTLRLAGLRLIGAQQFVRNFDNPDTPYSRLLIKWQTGTGKSIAGISIANEFVRSFRARAAIGDRAPTVFVISFTARETFQEDMLRHPEFGFISQSELEELRRMKALVASTGAASPEARQLAGLLGVLRRRITDRTRGGYYQFYGYKEFANHLLTVTPLGTAAEFDLRKLPSESFGEALREASKRGEVRINEELLDEMRGGLLIADEIHEAYNIQEENNYGIAIQYALDALGDDAPRGVFISATPATGSAAEIIDLLNLLVPRTALPGGVALRRGEFFDASHALRPGALDRIRHLAAGRVSYLLDSDVGSYPRRLFVGDDVPGVPYLKLTLCPMSPFHARTLRAEQATTTADVGLSSSAFTLNDMAFPNPAFAPDAAETDAAAVGLYLSADTVPNLAAAPDKWRVEAGVLVSRGAEAGMPAGIAIVSGSFLSLERLAAYSTKYARGVEAVFDAVRSGPGKILVFHPRVRMSGVLLIQEALRMNGFADDTSMPTDATICSVCGVTRVTHKADGSHQYIPARFVVAHSIIDRATMKRNIDKFNSAANADGYQIRVLIGSKIIRQSLNFRAVRHEMIFSMPSDYPTLLQIFGRVVRKESHSELPEDQRDVKIRIFVSVRASGAGASFDSPELQRYREKGREYLENIQAVERVLHECAVDGYANRARINAALGWTDGKRSDSLDALAFTPMITSSPGTETTSTFDAYGHGEREVVTIVAICHRLFQARPVWTYDDLWRAVRGGVVAGVNYNTALFDEGNFALALEKLARPWAEHGTRPTSVVVAPPYYVRVPIGADGRPVRDVESYLRTEAPPARVSVPLGEYLRTERAGENFTVRLRAYEAAYLSAGSRPLDLSLVEYGAEFHYALLTRLIENAAGSVTSDDKRVKDLYKRFRIAVTSRGALVGYVTESTVNVYDGKRWQNAPHAEYKIGRRQRENKIVVGFVTSEGVGAKFKIRPPMARLKAANDGRRSDIRMLARGGVCETRPRDELESYVRQLRSEVGKIGGNPSEDDDDCDTCTAESGPSQELPGYGSRAASALNRPISATGLCNSIRHSLLALEERARAPADGMMEGTRWLYLFNERPPSIAAMVGQR